MKGCDKQWAFTLVGLCIVFCFSAALTATASAAPYYVNPGESIQAAVDNASDGDMIIVRDGTYTENINVNKRLTFRSENGYAIVQAANTSDSVFEVTADHVNILGFTVENSNSSAGISLNEVAHCNISNNNLANNFCAIYSSSSKFNIIVENTLADNVGAAICLYNESDNNKVVGNNISNNTWGVWIGYYGSSSHNIISDNAITVLQRRYRVSLEIIYSLYLQIFERVKPDTGLFTKEEMNPSPAQIQQRIEATLAAFQREN